MNTLGSSHHKITLIEEIARDVLAGNPGEVVRFRLLRDALRRPPGDPELQTARDNLEVSRCIQELAEEQWADGGWGAFHSRSRRRKQKIASTEVGVERALALGLESTHPVLQKTTAYIIAMMNGKVAFPDYHEKNDRWPTGMRLFLASALSLILPNHPLLDSDRELWLEIAKRAFQSGAYQEEDEMRAHAELTGATVKDSYLVLNGRYQLNILGSIPGRLPENLETALLGWLWSRPDGIGYLEVPLGRLPPPQKPGAIDRWFASLEILARLFPTWVDFAGEVIEWLWEHRLAEGLWDFGPRPGALSYFPLSDNWRRGNNRAFDWTTRTLALLRKYEE